jgi:predicted P-loop ATPase
MSDPNARFRTAITPHNAVAVWGLAANAKGAPLSTHANVGLVIDHMPELLRGAAYDEFLDRTIVEGREWREGDDTGLCMWLQEHLGLSAVTPGMVHIVVDHRLRATPQHCVRAWLDGLVWDQEPRIALAFEECWGAVHTADQPADYVRAVSANLFIGLVARVMRPGCQLDTMPIFEGPQGLGKSSALRLVGGDWYALGAESVTSKDFFQVIPGKWLIEIGEMDSFSRAERERTKIAISTPVDRYRASYGRYALDHPRQCVFAGTTNRDDYGHDDTGLRRFWPVRCTDILLEDIASHRDQWFAEAVAQFRAGASWWAVPTSAGAVQRARQAEDMWTAAVLAWCTGKDRVTSAEVAAGALALRPGDMDRAAQLRISHVLQLAGWTRQTIRRPGEKPVKGFMAPDV